MSWNNSLENEGDSRDASSAAQGRASHMAGANAGIFSNSFNTLGGSPQFKFGLDPGVMLMSNAAATIAAVAASAVQQMNQGKHHQNGVGGSLSSSSSGISNSFVGARNLLSSHGSTTSSEVINQHVANLFGAAAAGHSTLPYGLGSQGGHSVNSSVQRSLGSSGEGLSMHPLTSSKKSAYIPPISSKTSMPNVLLPGMQSWSLEQLGENALMISQGAIASIFCELFSYP